MKTNLWKLAGVLGILAIVTACAHLFPASNVGYAGLGLLGLGAVIGSINDSVSQDKSAYPVTDTVRQQHDLMLADFVYGHFNRPAFQVAAAAVAPPGCATATVTSQVKTTATSQFFIDGTPVSISATDNLWTLTGGNLAAGSVRKYELLWDGTSATTVVTVLASNDVVIGAGTSAQALAKCRFPSLPPKNAGGGSNAIVGILSIVNLTNPFIPGTTLLGAAGVTATYRDGADANVFQASVVTP